MAKVGSAKMTTEPLFRQLMPKPRPHYATPYEETLAYLERLAHVQNLRDQLRETSVRLGDSKTENERLRYLYNSSEPDSAGYALAQLLPETYPPIICLPVQQFLAPRNQCPLICTASSMFRDMLPESSSLTALRKSLAVAEQDVRKKQEEMEELRSQLVNQDYEQRVAALQPRLITMLRVQLAAIANITKTQILDRRLSISEDIDELKQMLDDVNDGDLDEIQKILEHTTVIYDQISRNIVIPSQSDSWTMTEALEGESDFYDDEDEVDTKQESEWQAEMTAIQ
ncbi:hypothetical protein GCK32_016050, partial [Trichostrongylus colubriformis]